jgi:sugar fermentation stimulation protein A
MKYSRPLQRVKLIRRYKRFLADVEWPDGSRMTVHTANTGSMLGCATPDSHIWIRDSGNDKRKYRYSWEISETEEGSLVGVNTGLANHLVVEAIGNGTISELSSYQELRTEVPYGERSRIDILLQQHREAEPDCYVEVKNVTARVSDFAIFPDAVTARGTKHLLELVNMVKAGQRAMMLFCVQRDDVTRFRPAAEIDTEYARTLVYAVKKGVEALAYRVDISPEEIRLCEKLPLQLT